MADEFDIIHLDQEDAQEIINWAVAAAGIVILMDNAPIHETPEEAVEKLQGYIEAVEIMWDKMPDVLAGPAAAIAEEALEEATAEEEAVEEFRKEIENL